ncbi:MAG TPA: TIGR02281 family clan AA aspartic protease [Gammaproteobacteria bacterium]|nr:TIGR02281 family clan AA aspartic protease [Gammaproteobacteria bacterium]
MRKARSLAGEGILRVLGCLLAAGLVAAARGADGDGGPRITARALFEDRALLEIDGRRRVLKAGQRSPEGVLLVGADPRAARVEVAGRAYTIALDASISTAFSRGIEPKRLALAPASDGHYYVDGTINGTGVRFVVDTGASTVAISRHDAKRIGLLYRVDGEPAPVETASGVATAYRVVFRSVKARAIEVTNVPGIVIDGDYPTVALLGQSFLNRLDLRRQGLLLELKER